MTPREAYERYLVEPSDMREHLPRLREAARGNCLEIGVRTGISTAALLVGLEEKGGFLTSIDIEDCRVFTHPQWCFVQADSQKMDRPPTELVPAGFVPIVTEHRDLVLIDGDHTYEGALHDLRVFGSVGETVFVHDTEAPAFPGVRQAVEEFIRESGRTVEWILGSYGMAVIR